MKLIDLMNAIEDIEAEMTTFDGVESPNYSFIWSNEIGLSDEGCKHFRILLDSDVSLSNTNSGILIVKISDKTISIEDIDDFLAASFGDCSESDYDKWFVKKK